MTQQTATILLVDNTPSSRALFRKQITRFNFQVIEASNGRDAIQLAEVHQPNLILLDVMMPELDGFTTCQYLKNRPTTKDIPVIFMTAMSDTVRKVKGLELGAVDYITKPVDPTELLARLNTHLTMRQLQKDLEEQVQELDSFAHTVAHDLKGPLGIMVGYADLMNMHYGDLNDDLSDMLQQVQRTGHKLVNIIDELLMLSSVRRKAPQLEPLDMPPLIDSATQRLSNLIEDYQVELHLPEVWPPAMGYGPWIEEVWVNYLSNAIKYGGRPPQISLGGQVLSNGDVQFWVKDNGHGISAEAQAKLFSEFTRLRETRVEGHGLGLSIVRRIMNKLKGTVGVSSQIGQGSTFYFILPSAFSIDG